MTMRKILGTLMVLGAIHLSVLSAANAEEAIYYARCNLKIHDNNEITWVNWQAAPTFIPADTKLRVTRTGDKASLVNVETRATYTLDVGADGQAFLEKFVSLRPVDIQRFPEDIQANIRNAVAKVGMTKEQVYIAMGPPTNLAKLRTNAMTYENIMAGDLWVYARRRFAKNIGVAFDPASGTVNRTEGIWGK
jgi:hypothetical protein